MEQLPYGRHQGEGRPTLLILSPPKVGIQWRKTDQRWRPQQDSNLRPTA
jgi:hypothetical protein